MVGRQVQLGGSLASRLVIVAMLILVALAGRSWAGRISAQGHSSCTGDRADLLAGWLPVADAPAAPQAAFPGAGFDSTFSIGRFRLAIEPAFRDRLEGMPGYDAASGNLDSPLMSDRQTLIWRSDPLVNGSPEDAAGVSVGGVTVADGDFEQLPDPAVFPDVTGTREIHLAIRRFRLVGDLGGLPVVEVRAGTDFPGIALSPGEVRSQSASPEPPLDLPGRSFFNIHVEVDLPLNPMQPIDFPGATVYNSEPLLVQNLDVDRLPPRVVYTHEGPVAVPVRFKEASEGRWAEDEVLGYLTLAGHGVCFQDTPRDVATLDAVLGSQLEIPTPEPPSPTPTPSLTPSLTPSITPSLTPSATVTPSATATASATPTERPAPAYLPLLLRESCPSDLRGLDVALVVDSSSSMAGAPMAAAREGALAFLDALQLDGGDRIALVTFHGQASLRLALSDQRQRIHAAIEALEVNGTGTAIDEALRVAARELSAAARPERAPLLILLTDGRQGGGPAAALAAAELTRAEGILIYTIALGPEADLDTLRTIAGAPARALVSPSPAELRATYRDLGWALRCPGDDYWPRVP